LNVVLELINAFSVVWFLWSYGKNIFKHGDIQNTSLILDIELNISIYRTPS